MAEDALGQRKTLEDALRVMEDAIRDGAEGGIYKNRALLEGARGLSCI